MAEEKKDDNKAEQPIIVKKIIKKGGHHGGAWKVAYADFVTAMMAFFLLLWLLNVATSDQLSSISNYFDPTHPKISNAQSGAGGILGGLSMVPQGAMASRLQQLTDENPTGKSGGEIRKEQTKNGASDNKENNKNVKPQEEFTKAAVEKAKAELRKEEEKKFENAKSQLMKAIEANPELESLAKNLIVDITPEGLRIQIVDQDGEAMFASGSARMFEKTKHLMQQVAGVIKDMPNQISVRGHTDSVPYGPGAEYTNWELSSDRANASRRVLMEAGIPAERLNDVVGKADTEHLYPDNPEDPRNRRISIMLIKEELTDPDFDKKAESVAEEKGYMDEAVQDYENQMNGGEDSDYEGGENGVPQVPIGTFRRSPGSVEFP